MCSIHPDTLCAGCGEYSGSDLSMVSTPAGEQPLCLNCADASPTLCPCCGEEWISDGSELCQLCVSEGWTLEDARAAGIVGASC